MSNGNGFSFDEAEFSDVDSADQALQSLEESPATEEQQGEGSVVEDPELADVDLRLEVADYYRAILGHAFFDVTGQAATMVDTEIRAFIRERLEVLLGLRSPRAQDVQQFEENEVQALKILAAKVLAKPGLVESKPQVKKMPTPAPTQKPEVRRKPQVRTINAPQPAPSTKPKPKPKTADGLRPRETVTPVKVVERKAPTEALAKAAELVGALPPGATGESQTYQKADGTLVTLVEGEVIEDQGRRYRVVRNDHGTLYRRDITGQQVPSNRVPQPTAAQMSMISQQHALDVVSKLDGLTGVAVQHSLKTEE